MGAKTLENLHRQGGKIFICYFCFFFSLSSVSFETDLYLIDPQNARWGCSFLLVDDFIRDWWFVCFGLTLDRSSGLPSCLFLYIVFVLFSVVTSVSLFNLRRRVFQHRMPLGSILTIFIDEPAYVNFLDIISPKGLFCQSSCVQIVLHIKNLLFIYLMKKNRATGSYWRGHGPDQCWHERSRKQSCRNGKMLWTVRATLQQVSSTHNYIFYFL